MAKAAQQLGPAAHTALYDHRREVRAAMQGSMCMRDHLRRESGTWTGRLDASATAL
jgi:hypothetical protein